MATLSPLRIIAVAGLGLAAPHIWVESMFPWSWYVYTPLLKGLWSSFAVKGTWIAIVSQALHSVLVGILFGFALRGIAGHAWLKAGVIFCIAFLVSLIGPGLFDSSISIEENLSLMLAILGEVAFLFACVIAVHGVLSRYLRSRGA